MKKIFQLLMISTILIGCSDSTSDMPVGGNNNDLPDNNGDNGSDVWLIDKNIVFDGGPGKDGIPALDNPDLIDAMAVNYLSDDDLVIGFKIGNEVVAYPHKILDWHEIINDDFSNLSMAIIYCPLTGTAIGWNRRINNSITTFGVSGLLYKSNIVPYDRLTGSNWSQLRLQCVNGELRGKLPDVIMLTEMNWMTWKKIYPQSKVVSLSTGFNRNYDFYPYGSYRTNHGYFIFPIDPLMHQVPAKERVHATIINNKAKVYRFENFSSKNVIRENFEGKELVVVGNQEFIVSYELDANTMDLIFNYSYNDSEVVLSDNEGNEWNLFGEAIAGPRKGSFLKMTETSMMAYYFSIDNFYPDVELYN